MMMYNDILKTNEIKELVLFLDPNFIIHYISNFSLLTFS